MVYFILGISLCLNIVFLLGILIFINYKKNINSLKDTVSDLDSFNDFFK